MVYSNSITLAYKGGFIHIVDIDGVAVFRYQVDRFAYPVYAKSVLSCKMAITKAIKSNKQLLKKVG